MTGYDTLKYYLESKCKELNLTLETEYKFLEDRKYRFDFAITEVKTKYVLDMWYPEVAFEYEGGLYMNKSGHTNAKGYFSNCNKYNLATLYGWRVYRFTAKHFDKSNINETLKFIDKIFDNV